MPNIISRNQNAFVKRRCICTINIGLNKAFDSVDWVFLLNVLNALNLPSVHQLDFCMLHY